MAPCLLMLVVSQILLLLLGIVVSGSWYLAGVTFKPQNGILSGQIWVNGIHRTPGFDMIPGSTVTPTSTSGIDWLFAGTRNGANNDDFAFPFSGSISEVYFFNCAFSSSDWTALYNSGNPINPKSHPRAAELLHWYRMGDGDTYPYMADSKGVQSGTMMNMASGDIQLFSP